MTVLTITTTWYRSLVLTAWPIELQADITYLFVNVPSSPLGVGTTTNVRSLDLTALVNS